MTAPHGWLDPTPRGGRRRSPLARIVFLDFETYIRYTDFMPYTDPHWQRIERLRIARWHVRGKHESVMVPKNVEPRELLTWIRRCGYGILPG
jgi:hypothetical protein